VNTDQSDVYQMTAQEVVARLDSDQRRGLSGQEAAARLQRYGPNELETEKPVPAWRRFLAQFQDVLIILLLIATAISVGLWVYERDTALPYEGLTIFAIVLLNGILGYVQEARAERAVAALRAMSANEATVLRDGERRSVPAAELVPGDILLIEEGGHPARPRQREPSAVQEALEEGRAPADAALRHPPLLRHALD
jgi:Ca2+-transporting ATPase